MTQFQKWLLWVSSILTGVTGVVYWWMKNMMDPVAEWAVINHPLQPWVLKAHIVAAPVLIFAIGLVAGQHIWKHFRTSARRGRRSGLITMYVLGPMVFSGYLIQVVTHPALLATLVWLHVGTGALYLVGLAAHDRILRIARSGVSSAPRVPVLRQVAKAPPQEKAGAFRCVDSM